MKLTKVRAVLCAAHRDATGQIHGHTWTIWACWPSGDDALALQMDLTEALAPFDHGVLPDHLARGEDLAEAIGLALTGCISVAALRDPEGFAGEWRAI